MSDPEFLLRRLKGLRIGGYVGNIQLEAAHQIEKLLADISDLRAERDSAIAKLTAGAPHCRTCQCGDPLHPWKANIPGARP